MEVQTFRPRIDNEDAYRELRVWCEENSTTISAVINSILQPLAYACANKRTNETGIVVNMDFGDIVIH